MNNDLAQFENETRQWLLNHCPDSMRVEVRPEDLSYGGRNARFVNDDAKSWLQAIIDKGYTAPDWPEEYGGGGLNADQLKIFNKLMRELHCWPPVTGHGLWMLGPALLEYGSQAQKQRFIPDIVKGPFEGGVSRMIFLYAF